MSPTVPVSYRRNAQVLWRDTGDHVLALSPGGERQPALLGGGSAVLWRLLAVPRRVPDIVTELAGLTAAPSTDEVVAAMEELRACGLVLRVEEAV